MKKKLVSSVLITAMLLSMTACGSDNQTSDSNAAGTADGTEANGDGTTTAASDLEPVTLKMYFHGSNVTDDSQVLEKVNEYLQQQINVTLEPIWGTWGDFDTNAVLSLQGGDDVDIYCTCSWC